jgi:outer membrane protein assembly factor BamB
VKIRILGIAIIVFFILFSVRAEGHDPLWRFITGGRIRSYPAVGWDGSVFILSDDRFLYALTPAGEQRWRYYLEERLTDCFAIGYDGMIYVGYKTGELFAVHGYGRRVWQFDTGQTPQFSPAIRGDGSICLATAEGTMFAIHHTGSLLWKQALAGTPAAPPVADVDNSLYVCLKEGELVALEPWGEIKWRLKLSGVPAAPAIGEDGRIYVGTSAGLLYAVDPLPKITWSVTLRGNVLPPVVGGNGTIYAVTAAGDMAAVSRAGETLWTRPLGEIPSGPCALGDAGTIFVATQSSSLIALDTGCKIKWSVKVKGVLSPLCLSPQERLYAGSSDWAVYAFPAEKPAASVWPVYQHDVSHTGGSQRPYSPLAMEQYFSKNADFIYFQSLFLSGDAGLMAQGLEEVRALVASGNVKGSRPYLLYFLKKMAGFTVIEEEKSMRFPLRGFSEIRQQACELYTDMGELEAWPLLLSILKRDEDFRMKAVAVRCLGRLQSDPAGEAVRAMGRLIQAGVAASDSTFAQEVVIALQKISEYHGRLPREGVLALITISGGPYTPAVRQLARETLLELGRGN